MERKEETKAQKVAEKWARAILEHVDRTTVERGLVGSDSEAERMRRVPGIEFADGATGRRARVAGTRIGVWVVVEDYLLYGRADLPLVYDWLKPEQLDAALTYYELYPEEIDERIALGEALQRMCDPHLAK